MASSYQKLSISEKRARDIASVRESAEPCPGGCGMKLMPDDLLSHLDQRCTGPAQPGPAAKWVTWREARDLGVARETLYRWAKLGRVRTTDRDGVRRFLKRDLIIQLAARRAVVVGVPTDGNEKP